MLNGISPLFSPELLATIYRMGHGDSIVFGDAHFPGESKNPNPVIRADGLLIPDLLDAVLPLFTLDAYIDDPVKMMAPVPGDQADPTVEAAYRAAIDRHYPDTPPIAKVERFAFYDVAAEAFAVVMTGDAAKYGNIILTKGVTPSA